MTVPSCKRVRLLLSALPAGELEPAEAECVEAHLASCEACRRQAEAFFRQDRALAELAARAHVVESLAARIRLTLQGAVSPSAAGARPVASEELPNPEPCANKIVRPRSRATRARWGGGIAAAVLIALGIWFSARPQRGEPPEAFARVQAVEGAVFLVTRDGKIPVRPGQEFSHGHTLQTSGEESSAVVVYSDSTRLELGADTTITAAPGVEGVGKRVSLDEGYLAAEVADQPRGRPMVLATTHAEVKVLGTTLSLSEGATGTHIEIGKGAVELTRKSDGRWIEIGAGFDAVATGGFEPLVPQPLAPRLRTPRFTLEGYKTAVLSPDGRTLVATGFPSEGAVELWDWTTGQRRTTLQGHTQKVTTSVFSWDGKTLATGSADLTVKLWDAPSGRLKATLGGQPGRIQGLAFSADGKTLAVLTGERDGDKTAALWDVDSQRRLMAPRSYATEVWALSPDGQLLAAVGEEGGTAVGLWELSTGRRRATLRGFTGSVVRMAFSPDGARIAAYSSGDDATLWDVPGGQVRGSFRAGFGGQVSGLALSPDGRTLATENRDGVVRLWDVVTGKQAAALEGRADRHHVAFGSDGKTLVTSDRRPKGTVRLWDVPADLGPAPKGDADQ